MVVPPQYLDGTGLTVAVSMVLVRVDAAMTCVDPKHGPPVVIRAGAPLVLERIVNHAPSVGPQSYDYPVAP